MKKIVIGGGLVVIVAVVLIMVFVVSNLNSVVAGAIEKQGGKVTDTRVGVSGVDISLREGRGSIKGLSVASPKGFKSGDAFSLGDITVDIDLKSVTKSPVVLDAVKIQAPVINVEVTKTGATNIEALRKRVQAYTGDGGGESGGSGSDKKIRIKSFVFEQGRIEVDASALGVEKRTITLPEIRMTNVGGTTGATPDEITRIIVSTVAKNVTTQISKSEVDRLIKDKLGGSVEDKAKGLLKKIGG